MATNLAGLLQGINPAQQLNQGIASGQVLQQNRAVQQRADQLAGINSAISQQISQGGFRPSSSLDFEQLALADPDRAAKVRANFENLSNERKKAYHEDVRDGLRALQDGNGERFVNIFEDRLESIDALKGDPTGSQFLLDKFNEGDIQGLMEGMSKAVDIGIADGFLKDPNEDKKVFKSGRQLDFESRLEGLSPSQQKEATLISLGLSPRAVGSSLQTISAEGIADEIGNASATIKQRAKFGEMKGASRSRAIDKSFDTISKIDVGINNINSAIKLLKDGAGVGSIERFLPSFRASTVALENVQKRMALDVIGAVTFGALSQGELDLAKQVALPTGLNTPELMDHLEKRGAAQRKLRAYYNEQIQFLDQGGSVAGFMRQKERQQEQPVSQATAPEQEASTSPSREGGVLHTDAQGNKAFVFPDGSFEEVN